MDGKQDYALELVIVDCRYPFEYEGGHIKGALNLFSNEMIHKRFISTENTDRTGNDAPAIASEDILVVFHCEYSSARGPAGCVLKYFVEHALSDLRLPHLKSPFLQYI